MFPKRYSTMRLFIYVTVVIVFILAGSLFHDTYSKLNAAKGSAEKCTQLQESLSAQLQVVYEHKSRLEKTLHQEKANHKHTEEEFQAYKSEAEATLDKEKQEANNRYTSLKQQYEMLQNQHSDLQSEFNRLQQDNTKLLEEKQRLLTQTNLEVAKLREEKDAEITHLQEQLNQANNDKVQLQMSHDNAVARLKNAEQQFSQVVSEVQYLRYKYQEAQNDNQESKKIIDLLNKKLENKSKYKQFRKEELNDINEQHQENDVREQPQQLEHDAGEQQLRQERDVGEQQRQEHDAAVQQQQSAEIEQLRKQVLPASFQHGDLNTKKFPGINFLSVDQRQFPQQNVRAIHHQIVQPKQLPDTNSINQLPPFNKAGGQRIYFNNDEQPIRRQVNQDFPINFAAQPHISNQDQSFQQFRPLGFNKRNNLSIQHQIAADQDQFKDINPFDFSHRVKDGDDMGKKNKEFKNYIPLKNKGADFKEAQKQVPRPRIDEKEVKRLPGNKLEKPDENAAQVGKPDTSQDQFDNIDQLQENRKIENQAQMAKPLIQQQHVDGIMKNLAVPQLDENDEDPLLHPVKKDDQQDVDAVGNDAGDTQEKEDYKDQEDEKNIDDKEEINADKREM